MVAERPWWAPQPIDLERPNAARVYDYMLGGGCHFEVDRRFAERFLEMVPDGDRAVRANRAFLGRGVRFFVRGGGSAVLSHRFGCFPAGDRRRDRPGLGAGGPGGLC